MTSKESTYRVVKSINNSTLDSNGNVNVICEDTILNDLEVLEIIKTRIKDVFIKSGSVFDNIEDDNYFHLKFGLTGKEYKKIKMWLENEGL